MKWLISTVATVIVIGMFALGNWAGYERGLADGRDDFPKGALGIFYGGADKENNLWLSAVQYAFPENELVEPHPADRIAVVTFDEDGNLIECIGAWEHCERMAKTGGWGWTTGRLETLEDGTSELPPNIEIHIPGLEEHGEGDSMPDEHKPLNVPSGGSEYSTVDEIHEAFP
jgi:hypothetical protein